MRDIAESLGQWLAAGEPFAMATLVSTRGSAPRAAGAVLAVDPRGETVGSLSGGCVEGAVHEQAVAILASGEAELTTYGISDDEAFAVGLTCGGMLDVLIQRVDAVTFPLLRSLLAGIEGAAPVALAMVTGGPAPLGALLRVDPESTEGTLGDRMLDAAVAEGARGMLAAGRSGTRHYGPRGQRRLDDVSVFIQVFTPPPRMLVFGAIDFAAAVARLGVFLGYHVTVCDARPVFATRRRFPEAHEVVCAWPHRYLAETEVDARTVICVLTHDPKFDVPLLEVALRSPAAYIGAMGSRRTHTDRLDRLREAGVSEADLTRLHAPIGLDIGARTPEETAVSIAAEIVHAAWGGSGQPLSSIRGAIHREPLVDV